MPGDNPLLRHWQTQVLVFQKNLSLLKGQMNVEAIHDLRVAIKKLRSYFKLYAALFKKKDTEKLFAGTKELFSVLGRHRNIEMSKQLLLSFAGKNKRISDPLLVHLQLLQDQISDYSKQVLEQYETKDLNDLTHELEQDFQDSNIEEILNKVKEIMTSSIDNIRNDLKHFKNRSHLIRKHLKDIFYWSKIFDNEVIFTKSQIKTIDKVLDLLGNIQDHEVLVTNLKYFRKNILSSGLAEYDLIKKIEARVEKKKELLLERANKITRELMLKFHKN
jgi:CHAD domain-containing protein